MYEDDVKKSAWHRVGAPRINSLFFALELGFMRAHPAFLIVILPSSVVTLITNLPPPQSVIFLYFTSFVATRML